MVLSLDFVVLGFDELLGVKQLVLHVLEVVLQDLGSVITVHQLMINFFVQGTLLLDDLIQLLVLFVSILWKIGVVGIFF